MAELYRNVMRDNMLINVSGRDGHAVGVDKNCEQNINFQKNWFAAKGVHGTWDQLGDLAPNIPIYRPLRRQFAKAMGNSWSGTTHTSSKQLKVHQKSHVKSGAKLACPYAWPHSKQTRKGSP